MFAHIFNGEVKSLSKSANFHEKICSDSLMVSRRPFSAENQLMGWQPGKLGMISGKHFVNWLTSDIYEVYVNTLRVTASLNEREKVLPSGGR